MSRHDNSTAPSDLTPDEAAEFLNVSTAYVVRLMDEGVLSYRQSGSGYLIPRTAVDAFRAKESSCAREAMRELVRESEELGLYEDT